jgi:hypothetical protein
MGWSYSKSIDTNLKKPENVELFTDMLPADR